MSTQTILQTAKARYDHKLQKNIIAEKYKSKLYFTYNNGFWLASIELIAALRVEELGDIIHLKDEFGNIVEINRIELLEEALKIYKTVMQNWSLEQLKARQKR